MTVASSGAAALSEVERRAFDVILSDIHMGDVSGVELLRRVRAHDLDVPVVLMTGQPTVETAMEAISLGVMEYLPKPTSNAEVRRVAKHEGRNRVCVGRVNKSLSS